MIIRTNLTTKIKWTQLLVYIKHLFTWLFDLLLKFKVLTIKMCSNIVINGMSTHKYGVMNSYHSLQCQKGLYEIVPKRPLLLILKALFWLPSNLSPPLTLQQFIFYYLWALRNTLKEGQPSLWDKKNYFKDQQERALLLIFMQKHFVSIESNSNHCQSLCRHFYLQMYRLNTPNWNDLCIVWNIEAKDEPNCMN